MVLFSAFGVGHGSWLFDVNWSERVLSGTFFHLLGFSVFGLMMGGCPAKARIFRGNLSLLRLLLGIAIIMSLA